MTTWQRALVTGASAGLGAEYARRLAADGTDLVLVARRRDRLAELATELRAQGRDVEVLVADLSTDAGMAAVAARLTDHDQPLVDLLVNNAGVGSAGSFADSPPGAPLAMVSLNVTAVVALAHAAVVRMRAAGRGTILNVSSIAGNQPRGELAVYGASKAFVTAFSQSVALELEGTGVTCTAVLPGLTHTEFHSAAGIDAHTPSWAWMTAAAVVDASLDAARNKRVLCIPGIVNKAYTLTTTPRPGPLRRAVTKAAVGLLRR